MRLHFNILWFEDNPDITEAIIEPVKEHLEAQGYYLKIVEILKDSTRLEEIIRDVNEKKLDVDLILMDYHLAGKKNGDILIKEIRGGKLLTDIIFYSDKSRLWDKIGPIDGIYITKRAKLEPKILAVTDHILKKALDLTNLRGLVMAEASELEDLTHQIILTSLEKEELNPETIRVYIKEKLEESLKSRTKKIERLVDEGDEPSEPSEFASLLDFNTRAIVLKKILKSSPIQQRNDANSNRIEFPKNSFDNNAFLAEVIKIRNKLAHVKESKNQDGRKVLKANQKGQDDFVFDTEEAFKIRKNLKKYYDILTDIYKRVTGKDWN